MNRPEILCFVEFYLPGFRSGGPVQSIANLVERLGDEFDVRIVTRDRDASDVDAYPDVLIDAWNTVGRAQVFYASNKTLNLLGIAKLLSETPYDILYLNSFFSVVFTGLPLMTRRLGMAPPVPCLIAPRGEFSASALALRSARKNVYIPVVKAIGLYQGLYWQASSDFEKTDIIRKMGSIASRVYVAPDLTPSLTNVLNIGAERSPGCLRLIFLSRITPMKNLDFLIRVLARVSCNVELAIYGPKEDGSYWEECMFLIDQLPGNVRVTIGEQVPQEKVRDVFSAYDLFVFPTRGENFGHVIFESLSVGTPVLVSDQTPWQQDNQDGLKVLSLDEALWAGDIEAWSTLDQEGLLKRRRAAVEYASTYAADNQALEQNRQLFRLVLGVN